MQLNVFPILSIHICIIIYEYYLYPDIIFYLSEISYPEASKKQIESPQKSRQMLCFVNVLAELQDERPIHGSYRSSERGVTHPIQKEEAIVYFRLSSRGDWGKEEYI